MSKRKLLSALLLVISLSAIAEPEIYQVELIIFKYQSPGDYRAWQAATPHEFSNALELIIDEPEGAPPKLYQLLSHNEFTMNKEESRLVNSDKFQVLSHISWLQPIADLWHAKAIHLIGGRQYQMNQQNIFEIDGTLTFKQTKYIVIKADLYLTEPNEIDHTELQTFHLLQTRRTHQNELNFIDSSQLGVLVKIFPVVTAYSETLAEPKLTLPEPEGDPLISYSSTLPIQESTPRPETTEEHKDGEG